MNDANQQYDPRLAEEKAKMQAQSGCAGYASNLAYGAGNLGIQPASPTLRDRVAQNLANAQREARRTDALYELQHLLEKNPDVARILELLEAAQVLRV